MSTCPCGCALAAWSMPWPVTSAGAAPWSPAIVHEHTPAPHVHLPCALFAPGTLDPEPPDGPTGVAPHIHPADAHLIDTALADTGPRRGR